MEKDQDLTPLGLDEIAKYLIEFDGWIYKNDKISKTFEFKSFSDVINFIHKLTPFFNQIDHHPDICINYKKARFDLTRYSIGGKVTARDFSVAERIEDAYNEYKLEINLDD